MNLHKNKVIGIGWRAKLGILVPSTNCIIEPEFNKMAPDGVSVHTARLKIKKLSNILQGLTSMCEDVERAAEALSDICPDVIAFGCTSGSFMYGKKWNDELIKRIERASGVMATTTSAAACEALVEMGIKKLALATPYSEEITQLEKKFIEDNGFKVISMKALGPHFYGEEAKYPPHVAYQLAKEVDVEEADGIFISCSNFRTIEILERAETDLKKPLVSSNQATIWKMLRMAKICEHIRGYGKLLTC